MKLTTLAMQRLGILLALPLALAACGGGGGGADVSACSTQTSLAVSFIYQDARISSPSSNIVAYKPGVAFSATPTTTGIPASCAASKRFSLVPQAGFGPIVPLPASVGFDASTGAIAGTLPAPLGRCYGAATANYVNTSNPVCDKGGVFESAVFDVTLTLPGYSDLKRSLFFNAL